MHSETIVLNSSRNVTLTCYILEVEGEFREIKKRPAVLIIPGGGYQMCSDREADPVAFPYLKAGYHVMILRYSVGKDAVWPNPLDDYEQAMELIRSKEEEWHLYKEKIAVVGFSAGGHLAACAATMAKNRPNAAILGYAVTMGAYVKECNPSAPDTITAVDEKTCPCFVFATRTDNVVPIENSIKMIDALDKGGIAFESHIYAYGPHGFSTMDSSVQGRDTVICNRVEHWVSDSINWLKDVFGDFCSDGMTKPLCDTNVNDDFEAFLSVDCTIGKLMKNVKAVEVMMPILGKMMKKEESGNSEGQMAQMSESPIANRMKLRDALKFANAPDAIVKMLNEDLSQIPNE